MYLQSQTHLSVLLCFVDWLFPDFAMLRDRVYTFNKRIILFLVSLDGEQKDWQRFEEVSLVLAGLTPFSTFCILLYLWILLLCNSRMATIFPSVLCCRRFFRICNGNTLFIIMRKVSNLEASYILFSISN
jgi:molybdopterin-containing oxidoreductase family membrane subunit